jgi:hypothetical protein
VCLRRRPALARASRPQALLRPLLLRFADPSEAARLSAARAAGNLLRAAEPRQAGGALPLALPVLVERLGQEALVEPSEAVREALARLAVALVRTCRALLAPHLQALGSIALGCCRDSHPPTLRAGHALMRRLALDILKAATKEQGAKAIGPFTTGLVDAGARARARPRARPPPRAPAPASPSRLAPDPPRSPSVRARAPPPLALPPSARPCPRALQ